MSHVLNSNNRQNFMTRLSKLVSNSAKQSCPPKQRESANTPTEAFAHTQTHTYTRWISLREHKRCIYTHLDTNIAMQSHIMYCIKQAACVLTFSFGADQAGWGVAERAQDGSYGQAQVLVARVQSDRGKAQVWQAGGFLWTNLYMRDLTEGERRGEGRRRGEKNIKEGKKSKCIVINSTPNTHIGEKNWIREIH